MQLKQGAQVYSAANDRVGEIDRVVIHPRTRVVTHIVVRKGILFKEDKVVPMSLIAAANDDRLLLREDAGDLKDLPPFEEQHYVVADEHELARTGGDRYVPMLYWYPPLVPPQGTPYAAAPPYVTETERNIPAGTVALHEGAKVIAGDDEDVGRVEQVLTSPDADRATHIVIEEGLLNKQHRLIPIIWIESITEEEVRLAIDSQQIERLKPYEV